MIKNILILSFIFLYGCTGYVPVFSQKTNYKFTYIELEGEKRINQIIYKNIKNLENPNASDVKLLGLKINTQKIKKIQSKDSKGNANKYKLEIKSDLEFDMNNNTNIKKVFYISEMYDDLDSQFELNKYEKKIIGSLTERLSEKIIIFLRTLE